MSLSIRKTIWNDWPALAAAVGVPILWALHFAFPYVRRTATEPPIVLSIVLTACLAAVFLWRVRRIAQLFQSGRAASAQITGLSIAKDRGRLEFVFEHNGELIHSWTPIHRTRAVLALQPGTVVDVLFDPACPTHAIVRHLYEG